MKERLAVKMMAVSELKPDPKNVKNHPEEQIEQLRASIRRFGFCDPIGVTPDGRVIEGHGRLMASKLEGLTEVPVLVITGLSEKEVRAYGIAHNQATMNTGLDNQAVRAEFSRLEVKPEDYPSLGYNTDDVAFLNFDIGGTGATDHNGHQRENLGALVPKVFRTAIEFENAEQFGVWNQFIEDSRERFSAGQTIAERLALFADAFTDGN